MISKSYTDLDLEKLAYNMNLLYELLGRIEAGESGKSLFIGLSAGRPSVRPHAEKAARLQDELVQEHICGEPKYKDAVSTLKTEFGHIKSVQVALEKVKEKCPMYT